MPIGMPSISDRAVCDRHRAVAASAAERAAGRLVATKAFT
jgi:hypothetical protein